VDKLTFPDDGDRAEQFTHLLRYAVLAPSSHNAQPWQFRLFERGIALIADYTRRLTVADPDNRELLMSLGAAIMNLRIAAAHFGFTCNVQYNHSTRNDEPIAFATLDRVAERKQPSESLDRLFFSIAKRHTNRHPFLAARVPGSLLGHLLNLAENTDASIFVSTDARRNMEVAHLVAHAERLQQADPAFRKELADWLRPNRTQKTDGITGAAFGISDVGSALAPWAVKTMDFGGFRARHDERMCIEAPALLVLHGEDTPRAWLAVGEVLQKILLTLTRDGLQFSFFNMPIEIPDARLALRKILDINSLPQLLLRVGYSLEKPVPTPRRPVEDCIIPMSE
jgi:nitroreductase